MTFILNNYYANRTRMAKSLKNDDAKLKGLRGQKHRQSASCRIRPPLRSMQKPGGYDMKGSWLTPEEIQYKRERKEKMIYLLLPVTAIIIGAVIAFLTQMTY